MAEPITYSFHWTPEICARLAALRFSGTKGKMLLAALATLVVMLAIAIFPVRIGAFPQDAILELLRGAVRRGGAA